MFDCEQGDVRCNNEDVVCPAGFDCVVNCMQDESCARPIHCPEGSACTVNYITDDTCTASVICRGSTACQVTRNDGACSREISCRESSACDINCGVNSRFENVSCGGFSDDCAIACTDPNACLGFVECAATDSCQVDCGPSTSCIASATCNANQVLRDCPSAATPSRCVWPKPLQSGIWPLER